MVALSASSKRPTCRASAPVNAPFSRPNNSLSISVDGIAAQLTRTIGRWRRARQLVDPRREHFLAGARLAEQQHRRIGGRDLLDQLHDLARRGTLENPARYLGGATLRPAPQAVESVIGGHRARLLRRWVKLEDGAAATVDLDGPQPQLDVDAAAVVTHGLGTGAGPGPESAAGGSPAYASGGVCRSQLRASGISRSIGCPSNSCRA